MNIRIAFALVALLALPLAAACDGGDGSSPASEPSSTATAGASPSGGGSTPTAAPTATEAAPDEPTPTATSNAVAGAAAGGLACELGPSAAFPVGETTNATIVSGGRERTFLIYVPGGYEGSSAVPLVLNFHGLGSNGSQQHVYAGLVPIAEREGFIVVSPDGVNNSWLITPGVNDIEFTRDLVAAVSEGLCIDPGAVFSTGMSNGGFMSAALACVAGDLVAAVAPVAGVLGPSANCGEPVPLLQFHGTDDAVVPYEGGTISATGGPFGGIDAIMLGWAEHNGCSLVPGTSEASDSVDLVTFEGCDAETAHYVVDGGGHTWPGGPAVPRLGPTTTEISASELMWEFFLQNRR